MPFNGSGTFNLSDTIANATPNDADEVQAIFDDIASGLSNTVAKDGQSTMTGPLKASNGTAAAPSYTFGSDTNTGFYRPSADKIGAAVNGASIGYFASTGWVGAVVGNVTGNVTGNLTGNVTGNVTGDVTGTASLNALAATTISAGTGLTGGGSLAANRTLALATSGASAGTYAGGSITVDTYGRITSISGTSKVLARGSFTGVATPVVSASAGVSTVTQISTGIFEITMSSAASTSEYQPIPSVENSTYPGALIFTVTIVSTTKWRIFSQVAGVGYVNPDKVRFVVYDAA